MNTKLFIVKLGKWIYRKFFNTRRDFAQDYRYVQLYDQDANDFILRQLSHTQPFLIAKMGTIELDALMQYDSYVHRNYSIEQMFDIISYHYPLCYDANFNINMLCSNAGFFPNDDTLLGKFYDEYTHSLTEVDIIGTYNYTEKYLFPYFPKAQKVNIYGYLYPFMYKDPWTKYLKNKKVLVVHPFQREIEEQYKRRKLVWGDRADDVLPDFKLITYKPVQSMLGLHTEYQTWFDALAKMKDDISQLDFDVAIIGCGAYGLPLAAYCKCLGKQAIHLAGSTQILFGIIGKRWAEKPAFRQYFNEYWIRPYSESIPSNYNKIEEGCYW